MPDLALQPPRLIFDPGIEYQSPSRRWQGIPGLERAPGSSTSDQPARLWATWYSGGTNEGPENHVVLVTSNDDGRTWSEPVLAIDPQRPVRAFDPVLWHDPHGTLWLFWAQSGPGHMDGRCGVWAMTTSDSSSARPTWTPPRRLVHGIMMNKPTVLSDGDWLMCSAIWNRQGKKKPETPAPGDCAHLAYSNVYRSSDHGVAWTHIGSADVPQRGCDEHMIVERRGGALWMLVRTTYGIGQSHSPNRGIAWSPGEPTGIVGPETRFFIRRLRSGRLLLVYHDHPKDRTNLTAWLSDDEGKTWPHKLLLDDREMVSYPDGVETDDGLIYLIYDRQRTTEREILMANFTEADILAGKATSPRACLRQVINRRA